MSTQQHEFDFVQLIKSYWQLKTLIMSCCVLAGIINIVYTLMYYQPAYQSVYELPKTFYQAEDVSDSVIHPESLRGFYEDETVRSKVFANTWDATKKEWQPGAINPLHPEGIPTISDLKTYLSQHIIVKDSHNMTLVTLIWDNRSEFTLLKYILSNALNKHFEEKKAYYQVLTKLKGIEYSDQRLAAKKQLLSLSRYNISKQLIPIESLISSNPISKIWLSMMIGLLVGFFIATIIHLFEIQINFNVNLPNKSRVGVSNKKIIA